jgi:hypothetical protein
MIGFRLKSLMGLAGFLGVSVVTLSGGEAIAADPNALTCYVAVYQECSAVSDYWHTLKSSTPLPRMRTGGKASLRNSDGNLAYSVEISGDIARLKLSSVRGEEVSADLNLSGIRTSQEMFRGSSLTLRFVTPLVTKPAPQRTCQAKLASLVCVREFL